MPADMAICTDKSCVLRIDCYRFRAVPEGEQRYFSPDTPGMNCQHFQPIYSGRKVRPASECQ